MKNKTLLISKTVLALAAAIPLFVAANVAHADEANPKVLPPNSHPFGRTYNQWSAAWWKWAMELPLISSTGAAHPFIDDPSFDVTEGQSGNVWFLAGLFGNVSRSISIPSGTALFMPILNAEASNLEGLGNTAAEQRANATATVDAAVPNSLSFSIDGAAIQNLTAYRVVSPQFTFTAPTPWVFGNTGGLGKAVGDGYYIMVAPLSVGQHTIHFTGTFDFGSGGSFSLDMTYNLSVQPGHDDDEDDD